MKWQDRRYQSYQSGIETPYCSKQITIAPDAINRTKVELKPHILQFKAQKPIAINRTKVELKRDLWFNIIASYGYQSYQSGIETTASTLPSTPASSINRTKVELKRAGFTLSQSSRSGYQSYQSGIETGLGPLRLRSVTSINRTKVELKHGPKIGAFVEQVALSIVPKWN